MNTFIKLACLSVLITASANAMQDGAKLGKWLIEATQENEHTEVLDLITQGAPVDYADEYGTTALMYAAGHGHLDCLEALIAAKANANKRTHAGNTALMQAVISGNAKCVHALIHAKALIDQTDKTGTSPLMIAASTGNLACLITLLVAGAQINQRDNNSHTAFMRATENGHKQCAQALATTKDLSDQLLVAAQEGNHQELVRLIGQGASVDYQDEDQHGCTALIYAASGNHLPCLQTLIAAKAEVNKQDYSNCTALIHLTFPVTIGDMQNYRTPGSQLDCMKSLIEAKANLNIEDDDGYYALGNVLETQDLPCVQALLAAGVEQPLINEALTLTAYQGYFDGVKALIEAKANLHYVDMFRGHRTALGLAANNHEQPMCELLIKAMLRKPTNEQKTHMRILLGCLRYKAQKLWELHRNRKELFNPPFFASVYEQNLNKFSAKDPTSMAYQEVATLPEGPIKQALLEKYNDNANASQPAGPKKAKME